MTYYSAVRRPNHGTKTMTVHGDRNCLHLKRATEIEAVPVDRVKGRPRCKFCLPEEENRKT